MFHAIDEATPGRITFRVFADTGEVSTSIAATPREAFRLAGDLLAAVDSTNDPHYTICELCASVVEHDA